MAAVTPRNPSDILASSLTAGAVAGVSGAGIGTIAAIWKPSPRVGFYAVGTGLNCFVLGSTYWGLRELLLRLLLNKERGTEQASQLIQVSTIAGTVTGAAAGYMINGRQNIVPGGIVFGVLGFGGQILYNSLRQSEGGTLSEQDRASGPDESRQGYIGGLPRSEKFPIRRLSIQDYRRIMEEKRLVIEADIALVTEEISRLENENDKQHDASDR